MALEDDRSNRQSPGNRSTLPPFNPPPPRAMTAAMAGQRVNPPRAVKQPVNYANLQRPQPTAASRPPPRNNYQLVFMDNTQNSTTNTSQAPLPPVQTPAQPVLQQQQTPKSAIVNTSPHSSMHQLQTPLIPQQVSLNASAQASQSKSLSQTPVSSHSHVTPHSVATNSQAKSILGNNESSQFTSSPSFNQSTPLSSHQQSRQATASSTLPPRDLFGNSPASMPSPIPRVDPNTIPLLYWNGFRILADHTLIDWLKQSTLVDLAQTPGIENAAIKAKSMFEFCNVVKQIAKEGERTIIGFGEELVIDNRYHPDKFGVMMLDLADWLVEKTKVRQLILFTVPPDLNRMRNSAYMSCIRQMSGKIWTARRGREQIVVFDLFRLIASSPNFKSPDPRNMTTREKRIIDAKPKVFTQEECQLLDGQFASFITKVADVKLAAFERTSLASNSAASTASSTNATSGSSNVTGSAVGSIANSTNGTGVNMIHGNPDTFDSEMNNLISDNQGVTIESDPDDEPNAFYMPDDLFSDESESYEDWCYSSVLEEEAFEDRTNEDQNNYYVETEGGCNDYQFTNDQDTEQFYDAPDHSNNESIQTSEN